MRKSVMLVAVLAIGSAVAQTPGSEPRPSVTLANDKLELTVRLTGASFGRLVLLDDATRLSPLWSTGGHFLCLDGFGIPTAEERAAGWPGHGEANHQPFEVLESSKTGPVSSLKMAAKLPLAQE